MFGSTRISNFYGPNKIEIDIVQKRETTEDTLRLYHELLEKARGEILEKLVVQNELVNFTAYRVNTDLTERIMIAFQLNGTTMVCQARLTHMAAVLADSKMELIRIVVQAMSDAIAEEIFKKALENDHPILPNL